MPELVVLASAAPWHPDPYCIDGAQIGDMAKFGEAPTDMALVRLRNGDGRLVTCRAVFAAGLDRLAI
jgi:hypothetical protein